MNNAFKTVSVAVCFYLFSVMGAFGGGPPFLTDDPEPVEYHHWEAYLFTLGDHSAGRYTMEGPAAEVNYGALPDTQLHLVVPMTTVTGGDMPTVSGLGDLELGVKYRFVHETNGWPQIGIFSFIELPTGDSGRGLGNGRSWFQLPLWMQKSWGPWTLNGGGGAVLNSAPGERNHPYGASLLQRKFGEHLSLGGEFFAQGRDADTDKGFGAVNFGGSYNFNEHFSLLFSAGHSVIGDNHTLWYFGFYSTW